MIRVLKRFEKYAPWLFMARRLSPIWIRPIFRSFHRHRHVLLHQRVPAVSLPGIFDGVPCSPSCTSNVATARAFPAALQCSFLPYFCFSPYMRLLKHEMGFTRFFIVLELYLMYALCLYEGKISDWGGSKLATSLANSIMPFYLIHSVVLKYTREFIVSRIGDQLRSGTCRTLGSGLGRYPLHSAMHTCPLTNGYV